MSAAVYGKRSPASFFDDECYSPVSASKRLRCSAALHFSPPPDAVPSPPAAVSPISHLRSLFPHMDQLLLERALEVSGSDLDIAVKYLNNLHLESARKELNFDDSSKSNVGTEAILQPSPQGNLCYSGEVDVSHAVPTAPSSGSEWVELIVREMSNASNMDDAKARASKVLEGLEWSIACASTEATQSIHKENLVLKERFKKLLQENDIWKRGFKTLRGQKEEFDRCSQELNQLKQMMSQRDEQLRKLQIENYDLKLRLMREQLTSPIPGRFHPDICG